MRPRGSRRSDGAIAQHSDTDLAFQKQALESLTAAAERDQASWGNVAYLTDRVAVAEGRSTSGGPRPGWRRSPTTTPR